MQEKLKQIWLFTLGIILTHNLVHAQCEVYDFYDNLVPDPFWYACNGGDYTLNIYSPSDWADYTVDWGDGTGLETGSNWISPNFISHTYSATVENFTITISDPNNGCSITGTLIMEEATNPSIVIPTGVLTQACAPHPVIFSNQSSNVSENTIFTWDFGDGSAPLVLDHTNLGQTISHTYEENTVDCNTEVTLFAENYCNTIQGGAFFNTFSPIQIYDTDDAAITASSTVLCFPDNEVTFTNTTDRNCFPQGNTAQRYEYWNFGDYWGTGQDSIIDWEPWPPVTPYTLQFPGNLGDQYEVMMVDSNLCGLDTAYISISIVAPPVAGINITDNEVCVGEAVTIDQQFTGNPDTFSWNFGDGLGWIPTGPSDITYLYNTPGTYDIASAIGIQSSGACADTAYASVTVVPTPDLMVFADNLSGCDDITVNFSQTSSNADTWEWEFGNGNIYNGDTPPSQNYTNPGDYVITLTGSNSAGCINTAQEVITVFNAPVVNFLADNVCEGTLAQFTDMSTSDGGDPIISWNWDFGDGTPNSSDENPTHQYALAGTYNATLSVSTINCNASLTIPLTVEAAPIPVFSPSVNSGCAPLDVTFENNSINSDSYTWDFGDQSGSFMEEPSHTFYNFSNADTVYNVILTASSNFGCYQSDSIEITVSPGAQASFTDNAQPPGCAPFTANFINTSYGASSYQWDFGDGTSTSNEENPSHLYINNTGFIQTYDVELIAYSPNGCNDTIVSAITVFPEPDFTFDVTPNAGCSPLVVQMPLVASGQTFDWDFGDGQSSMIPNPTHLYENNTGSPLTYTVTLNAISAFGCAGTSTSSLEVYPAPEADFDLSDFSGCSPLEITFTDQSIGASSGTYDFNDGNSAALAPSVTHTFNNTTGSIQLYQVNLSLENTFGCTAQHIEPIEVTPSAQATIVQPDDACSPYNVTFLNNSTNATGFEWDFGNGLNSTQNTGSTTYFNNSGADTTYTVTLLAISTLGCNDLDQVDVTVYSTPTADFSSNVNSGCSVVSVEFTNNSSGAETYSWEYGDGDVSNTDLDTHFHEFENFTDLPIEYLVTLTATNAIGCTDVMSIPITVYPQITAEFEQEENGCAPLTLTFDNESFGSNTDFIWDFGDGTSSSMSNPTHTFINESASDTTYTVELITSSAYGCQDVFTQDIVVYATPVADLSISSTDGCYPLDVTFLNQSSGSESYSWVYGTGEVGNTSETEHTHTFYNLNNTSVSYEVTLNAFSSNGCQSSDNIFIEVQPQLTADFDSPSEACSPFLVQFENNSSGALSYQWNFNDGSDIETVIHPSHIFENNTEEIIEYEVTLTIESYAGCTDTHTEIITVYPVPVAEFTVDPALMTFPETTVSVVNNTTGGPGVQYTWGYGDGLGTSSEENPQPYSYETWGDYTITLLADNGLCSDETSNQIEIIPPPPVAAFNGPSEGCSPHTVVFTNESLYGLSYHWEFGDGGQAFVANPVYTYQNPGIYSVRLTVTGYNNGETDELVLEEIIEVHASANAAFAVAPEEVNIPQEPVYMINLSSNADEYLWNFGDGTTSTELSPTHYYQSAGVYSVSLWANNEHNCPDSLLMVDIVTANTLSSIEFPNAFTPISGGTGGIYDPQSFNNNVFFPVQSGVEDYQLQIFNRWGELLFESKDVMIGWDGIYNGQLCKQDVYVWKAKVKFNDGTELTQAGDVTLLR